MSVCLCICLSVCLSVCVSVSLSVSLSVCMCISLSKCVSLCLVSILFVCPSVSLSDCVCVSVTTTSAWLRTTTISSFHYVIFLAAEVVFTVSSAVDNVNLMSRWSKDSRISFRPAAASAASRSAKMICTYHTESFQLSNFECNSTLSCST